MVKQTLHAIDPGSAESLECLAFEEMEADLVSFKCSAEYWWTHQALDLPSQWWVLHSNNIPLFLVMRELIKANQKASSSRQPKQSDCLVRLSVRNKLLFI